MDDNNTMFDRIWKDPCSHAACAEVIRKVSKWLVTATLLLIIFFASVLWRQRILLMLKLWTSCVRHSTHTTMH